MLALSRRNMSLLTVSQDLACNAVQALLWGNVSIHTAHPAAFWWLLQRNPGDVCMQLVCRSLCARMNCMTYVITSYHCRRTDVARRVLVNRSCTLNRHHTGQSESHTGGLEC